MRRKSNARGNVTEFNAEMRCGEAEMYADTCEIEKGNLRENIHVEESD